MRETTKLSEEIWKNEKAFGVYTYTTEVSEIDIDEEIIQFQDKFAIFNNILPLMMVGVSIASVTTAYVSFIYLKIAINDVPGNVVFDIGDLFFWYFLTLVFIAFMVYKGFIRQRQDAPLVMSKSQLSKTETIVHFACFIVGIYCFLTVVTIAALCVSNFTTGIPRVEVVQMHLD
ncbi:uncharacterized protein RJT20DRAFT_137148 [Scheffersomyces xylosifermentans]|uniref:uncharacterized protein n=1 Tax=Scheffersomyces xylosifermentans TaxID=1304137 RepID=UPI00315C62F6